MRYFTREVAVVIAVLLLGAAACSNGNQAGSAEATADPAQKTIHVAAGPVSVTIDETGVFPDAEGYTYAEATMHGAIERDDGSEGEYAVPLVLIYPHDGGNGVGVVDWLNTVTLTLGGFSAPADEWRPGQFALSTTGDYLFESGYTYVGVQWDKAVTDHFGSSPPDGGRHHSHLIYGTIDQPGDAFDILRHTADFLRDPSAFEGADGPVPVDTVLSAGFSQTGMLQMTFLSRGKNVRDGELVYDGHLLGKAGLICLAFDDEPPVYYRVEPCNEPPAEDGSKMIHVAAQGDVEAFFRAGRSRFPDRTDWRQYELAGVSHLPATLIPGLDENQNPISSNPVFRAAFNNLARWVRADVAAPPSRFLDGTLNPDGSFDTDLDADGNALGGLRLPHMERLIGGAVAGAPLGTYSGKNPEVNVDPQAEPDIEVLRWIGGYFEPFTDAELAERYPDDEAYLQRITRAVDALLEAGYILEQDRDAYVQEATL